MHNRYDVIPLLHGSLSAKSAKDGDNALMLAYYAAVSQCKCAIFAKEDTECSKPNATVHWFRDGLLKNQKTIFYDELIRLHLKNMSEAL